MPVCEVYARGRDKIFITCRAYVPPDRKIASIKRKIERFLKQQTPQPCPSLQEIETFASGSNMSTELEDAMIEHIESCTECDRAYTQALEKIFS